MLATLDRARLKDELADICETSYGIRFNLAAELAKLFPDAR
jgi:hypothetical protein